MEVPSPVKQAKCSRMTLPRVREPRLLERAHVRTSRVDGVLMHRRIGRGRRQPGSGSKSVLLGAPLPGPDCTLCPIRPPTQYGMREALLSEPARSPRSIQARTDVKGEVIMDDWWPEAIKLQFAYQ